MVKQKLAKVKNVADIVFCIDATGSMQDCIDNVKENIESFVTTLENSNPNSKIDWRARILAYRDFRKDSEYLVNTFNFVSSPAELKNQLDSISADGGDDEPESTLDAILYATKTSDWREKCHRFIVVFTDATPVPELDEKTIADLGIPDGFEIFSQTLQGEAIKLFLYGKTAPEYERISKEVPKATVVQYENAVEELRSGDFKAIMSTIGKTVSNLSEGLTVK
jgi:hypothetical protein